MIFTITFFKNIYDFPTYASATCDSNFYNYDTYESTIQWFRMDWQKKPKNLNTIKMISECTFSECIPI